MSYDSYFDAKIRTVGNSKVITIPVNTVEKLSLKEKDMLIVGIKRDEKKKK